MDGRIIVYTEYLLAWTSCKQCNNMLPTTKTLIQSFVMLLSLLDECWVLKLMFWWIPCLIRWIITEVLSIKRYTCRHHLDLLPFSHIFSLLTELGRFQPLELLPVHHLLCNVLHIGYVQCVLIYACIRSALRFLPALFWKHVTCAGETWPFFVALKAEVLDESTGVP